MQQSPFRSLFARGDLICVRSEARAFEVKPRRRADRRASAASFSSRIKGTKHEVVEWAQEHSQVNVLQQRATLRLKPTDARKSFKDRE
jgi:hypothetical protein